MKRCKEIAKRMTALILLVLMTGLFAMPVNIFAEVIPEAAEAPLKIEVSYSGAAAPEETFTVLVEPLNDAPEPLEGSENSLPLSFHKPTGSIDFTFSFPKVGTYVYEVSERQGGTEKVSYDDTVYTVTFDVFADGDTLFSVMSVKENDGSAAKPEAISFENTYASDREVIGDPPVKIKKSISGDKPKEDTVFTFVMRPVTEGAPLPEGSGESGKEVTINGSGEVEIGNISFNDAGVYEYTVTEKEERVAGYNYDDAVFRVVYTVTESADGSLFCERQILKNSYEEVRECHFVNQYTASSGSDSGASDNGKSGGKNSSSASPVNTGDHSHIYLYGVLFTLSLILLAGMLFSKRKTHER